MAGAETSATALRPRSSFARDGASAVLVEILHSALDLENVKGGCSNSVHYRFGLSH